MLGRFRAAFAGLLVSSLAVFAAAPEGPIRLPVAPVVPTPMPAPVPPGGSLALGGAMVAIVDADVDCIIIESTPGLVKIDKISGPRDVTAIFAGGTGGYEDRSYAGKNLYRVKAAGKGTVTLSVVPVGVKSRDEIKTVTFSVDAATKDCPDDEKKKDEEKKDPPPAVETAAWAIVIEETSDRNTLPLEQSRLLGDVTFWTGLKASGVSYRMYDKDSPDAKAKNYLDMVAGVKLPALLSLDKTGKKLRAVPLPTTAAAVRTELGVK